MKMRKVVDFSNILHAAYFVQKFCTKLFSTYIIGFYFSVQEYQRKRCFKMSLKLTLYKTEQSFAEQSLENNSIKIYIENAFVKLHKGSWTFENSIINSIF
jgi:hypothetical protein